MIQWIKHLPHKDLDQSSHPNIHVNAETQFNFVSYNPNAQK